jgi:hypothetical protein
VSYSHRPELGVGNSWPVNRRVDQHRSSDGHDGLNVAFGYSVVMVGPDASEEGFLMEPDDSFGEGL